MVQRMGMQEPVHRIFLQQNLWRKRIVWTTHKNNFKQSEQQANV